MFQRDVSPILCAYFYDYVILAPARKHQAQHKVTLFLIVTYMVRHHPIQRIRLTLSQIESYLT
jgi:hypothetical protein